MKQNRSERLDAALKNMSKSLKALERSATTPITEPRDISGIVKDFELLYELSWKTLKKFLEEQGHSTKSAKQMFSLAFQLGYIKNETAWLELIEDRNRTVHTYDEAFARALCERIKTTHLPEFLALYSALSE